MAVEIPTVHSEMSAGATTYEESSAQAWPKISTAWYAVAVFAVALMFALLDGRIIGLLVQPIKRDFHLNDSGIALLSSFAVIAFNALVAVPASRCVDVWPRNILMSIGIVIGSVMTLLSGLAQNFWQLFVCRMGLGLGGIVNGPATYSMMSDYFPREKLPRAIAVLQLGWISGNGVALIAGGAVVALVSGFPNYALPGIGVLHNWQLVFIVVGLPGFLVAALMRSVPEPARRGLLAVPGSVRVFDFNFDRRKLAISAGIAAAIGLGAFIVALLFGATASIAAVAALFAGIFYFALPKEPVRYLFKHWRLYAPQFFALAFSAVESLGTQFWQPTFFVRAHHWTIQEAAYTLGVGQLIGGPIGLIIGTWLTEHFVKKGDNAANMRVVAIAYTVAPIFTIATPLLPNPWLAVVSASIANMIGLGGAVPQNAALQSVTPNEMRGQVTALYLFVFGVIGSGLGSNFIALITDYVFKNENMIGYALAASAAIMTPIAAWIMWQGVKPYGEAIAVLKKREKGVSLTQ